LDSILGATLQYTGYDPKKDAVSNEARPGLVSVGGLSLLSNSQINFIGSLLVAVVGSWVASCWLLLL
jgi:uncharacterized membrane protein